MDTKNVVMIPCDTLGQVGFDGSEGRILGMQYESDTTMTLFIDYGDLNNIKIYKYYIDCYDDDDITQSKWEWIEKSAVIEQIEFTTSSVNIVTRGKKIILKFPPDPLICLNNSQAFKEECKMIFGAEIVKEDSGIEPLLKGIRAKREQEKEAERMENSKNWNIGSLSNGSFSEDHAFVFLTDVQAARGVVFYCKDLSSIRIVDKTNSDEADELEEDTEIKRIEFRPHKIVIKTEKADYTFNHNSVSGGDVLTACRYYFPKGVMYEDPEMEVEQKKLRETRRRADEEEMAEWSKKIKQDQGTDTNIHADNGLSHASPAHKEPIKVSQKYEFSSSAVRGGDVINPDRVIIENNVVTWKKKSKILIGGESRSIPLDKVSAVELQTGMVGTDITIRGNGYSAIHAKDFAKSDAAKIKSLLGF